ncbi:MAG: RHS repeat-associated core domain-containing protein [Phycisphaerae bacterium]
MARHAATRLYANRVRWYDPALMRFISPDPLGYPDGGNRYGYVGANPIARTYPKT